jgi:hypothetical protein
MTTCFDSAYPDTQSQTANAASRDNPKTYSSVLSYIYVGTSRHTSRGRDNKLHHTTIDGSGVTYRNWLFLITGYPQLVLASKDDE